MYQHLEIINPLSFQDWDELILSNKNHSFFHSSAWARVLYESYQYKPIYFAIINDKKILVLIPFMEVKSMLTGKRGVSLPFSDYSDPIISDYDNAGDIFKYLVNYGRDNEWKSLEIRGGNILSSNLQPSSAYYGHTLALTNDADKIFSTFRGSTKRNIKKAIKEGVTVGRHQSLEAIKEFYSLNCLTRKEHGLPPQPYYFFRKIFEHIISQNKGIVVLAAYKDRYIAGAVFFHFGDKVIYKYGASNKNHQHLRANNLVMWEAIKWYSENGYKRFCFGRTETENEGLLQFKRGWGALERTINYYKYDMAKNSFVMKSVSKSTASARLFHSMPISLLKMTGSIIYRHFG